MYSLTALTGVKRNENRREVVFNSEVPRHLLIVSLLSIVASLPVVAILAVFFRGWAVLAIPVVMFAGLVLFEYRQRDGMQLRNWQAILDERRSGKGIVYVAGTPLASARVINHQQQVIPASTTPEVSDMVGVNTGKGRKRN